MPRAMRRLCGSTFSASEAAKLMVEHSVAHLLVLDEQDNPIGILSSLDIAALAAWGLG